jgi:hypothetical protein
MQAFRFTHFHHSLDVTHSNVSFLSGNDIFLDSWNEVDVVQCTSWNDPKAWFFQITTGCERLNHHMMTILFMA